MEGHEKAEKLLVLSWKNCSACHFIALVSLSLHIYLYLHMFPAIPSLESITTTLAGHWTAGRLEKDKKCFISRGNVCEDQDVNKHVCQRFFRNYCVSLLPYVWFGCAGKWDLLFELRRMCLAHGGRCGVQKTSKKLRTPVRIWRGLTLGEWGRKEKSWL